MGWTAMRPTHWKNGKIDRKAECDNLFSEDYIVEKSAMVGSTYYAAVRTPNHGIVGMVVLTSVIKKAPLPFAYKDMSESMLPHYFQCPKSILKLLSPTSDEYALEWRKKCYEFHEKTDQIQKLPVGTRISIERNGQTYIYEKEKYGKGIHWIDWSRHIYMPATRIVELNYTILPKSK